MSQPSRKKSTTAGKSPAGSALGVTLRSSASPSPESSTTPHPDSPIPTTPDTPRPLRDTPLPETQPEDQPDEHQALSEPDPDPKDQDLAASLALLARKIGSMSESKPKNSAKPRSPDIFDGSDPAKVQVFHFQCLMYFSARRSDFPDDQSRVTFAVTYLKGNPLDWFQSQLSDALEAGDVLPEWFDDFPAFIKELRHLFGPRDPVTDAAQFLEGLRYKDNTKAIRYTLDFNRYARQTGWNDQALTRHYYLGLPDRLKDEIARVGKPSDLQALQDLVSTIDQRFWERHNEITREKRQSSANNSSNKSSSSNNRTEQRSDTRQSTPSATAKPPDSQNQNRNKDQKKPAPSGASSSAKPNQISDLLGPDGKLKPEERKRRMDQNLCLRCGGTGHTVQNCPHTSKTKSKGRAATTSSTPSATAAAGKA